ncbi:MAG: HAMP domain-containing protein [Elusimicrobia bacterium]|jgi:signal transduction histidine kinase|nr:HAMP domain-containing protein [Elusimicrobiota bacterium]
MAKYRRKKYLTEKKYQMRYTSVIILSMLIMALVIGGMAYWQIKIMNPTPQQLAKLAGWGAYTIRVVLLLAAAFFAGIFLSHKIIGPIRRIERGLEKLNDGEFDINVKLRGGDELAQIANQVDLLAQKLQAVSEKHPEIKDELKE